MYFWATDEWKPLPKQSFFGWDLLSKMTFPHDIWDHRHFLHSEVGGHLQPFISVINIPVGKVLPGFREHKDASALLPVCCPSSRWDRGWNPSLAHFFFRCHSGQRHQLLFICNFFSWLSNLAACADPHPDTLFTLQANISHFIAWQILIDTFENNYPSDTLRGRVVCFDGSRQENCTNSSRWKVLAQAGLCAGVAY